MKKFYRIPIAEQIQQISTNSNFAQSLKDMREAISKGLGATESFWGGSLVEEDLENINLQDQFTTTLMLSLGIDGVKCFKEANYVVHPVGIKIWNLHPKQRTSKEYVLLTALVPGSTTFFHFFHFISFFFLFSNFSSFFFL